MPFQPLRSPAMGDIALDLHSLVNAIDRLREGLTR
jgi:hypothetical protein